MDRIEKSEQRGKLNYAVKIGKVVRGPCAICGEKKVDGHHFDYTRPLAVVWLCRRHHRELHRAPRYYRRTLLLLAQRVERFYMAGLSFSEALRVVRSSPDFPAILRITWTTFSAAAGA